MVHIVCVVVVVVAAAAAAAAAAADFSLFRAYLGIFITYLSI